MQPISTKILCDFDGTTAANDVGNFLFRTFADDRCFDIVREWKQGKINSKECLEQECSITRVTKTELSAYCDSQTLDPYFKAFVDFCRAKEIEVGIASDGLDFYIEKILRNHGLNGEVEVYANHLEFVEPDRLRPQFPYFEFGCGECGNCKGFHVRRAQQDGSQVVYIGDGLSDRCGADAADMVFAKRNRDLIEHCRAHNIPHYEYDNFQEVMLQLQKMV